MKTKTVDGRKDGWVDGWMEKKEEQQDLFETGFKIAVGNCL